MSGSYGPADEHESLATIARALELGITFFDTADTYGQGHNEQLVGRALREHRDRALVATKFGRTTAPDGTRGVDGRPEYVRSACEASLRRLGFETIDLFYQHRVDPLVPIEETVGAMAELVAAGKVRFLGLSEASAEEIRRAAAVHPIAAVQSEFSLLTRDLEDNGVLAVLRELGIALVPYAPISRGLLSGTLAATTSFSGSDVRAHAPRFEGANLEQNVAQVERFAALARSFGATAAQLALAWVLAQGDDIIPLSGTKRVAHLEENVKALDLVLTPAQLQQIESIIPKGSAAGARSSEHWAPIPRASA